MDKITDRQADMIAQRDFQGTIERAQSRELLETALLGIWGMENRIFNTHLQVAGRPIFSVAICADCPKHFDPSIALEMYQASSSRSEDFTDSTIVCMVNTDFPITFELR